MHDRQELDSPSRGGRTGKVAFDVEDNELIVSLLKRQDVVLEQLDELNRRVEQAIEDIGKSRQDTSSAAVDDQPEIRVAKAA